MFNISDAEDFEIVTNKAGKAAVWKQMKRTTIRSKSHADIVDKSHIDIVDKSHANIVALCQHCRFVLTFSGNMTNLILSHLSVSLSESAPDSLWIYVKCS